MISAQYRPADLDRQVPTLLVALDPEYDLVRKRRVYEEHGVDEFWFVDLDARRVEQYVLGPEGYGPPAIIEAPQAVSCRVLAGLDLDLHELLGPER